MNKSTAQVDTPMSIFFFVLLETIQAYFERMNGSSDCEHDDGSMRMW